MARASKKGACSSNTQGAKMNCLLHDRRDEFYDLGKLPKYVNHNLSSNNRIVYEDKMVANHKTIAPLVKEAEKLYTEKTHQKCQKSFQPFRESVLHIKSGTTNEELMKFKALAEKTTGWKCIGIYVHEDEGHAKSKYIEGQEGFEINHHAHVLWYCQDRQTGKAIRCDKKKLSRMQDDLAEATGMERGYKASETGIAHRSSMQQRITAQEQRIGTLQKIIRQSSRQSEELQEDISLKEGQSEALANEIDLRERKIEVLNQKIKDMEDRVVDYMKRLAEKSPVLAKAVRGMVEMVKNKAESPSEAQKEAVQAFLDSTRCNVGMNAEDIVEHRKIGSQSISIASINVCSRNELSKMDAALNKIAEEGPDLPALNIYRDMQMRVYKTIDGSYLAQIGRDGSYAYPITMNDNEVRDYIFGQRKKNKWAMDSAWLSAIQREYPTRQDVEIAIQDAKRQTQSRSRSRRY